MLEYAAMTLPDFLSSDDGGFIHVTGHRIGLHHVLRLYNEGHSPEMIAAHFPTLSLALVHKIIAFYLDIKPEVDSYIADHHKEMQRQIAAAKPGASVAELRARLAASHLFHNNRGDAFSILCASAPLREIHLHFSKILANFKRASVSPW
jgi:uncharacterized protein (DUF433 family)